MQRTSELRKEDVTNKNKITTLEEALQTQKEQIEDYAGQLNSMAHELEVQEDRAASIESELIQARGKLELKVKMYEQLRANQESQDDSPNKVDLKVQELQAEVLSQSEQIINLQSELAKA